MEADTQDVADQQLTLGCCAERDRPRYSPPFVQEDARIRAVWAREEAAVSAAAEAERARQQALDAATLEANRRAGWLELLEQLHGA